MIHQVLNKMLTHPFLRRKHHKFFPNTVKYFNFIVLVLKPEPAGWQIELMQAENFIVKLLFFIESTLHKFET